MSSLTNGDEVIIDSAKIKNQFVTHINFIFNVDSNYFDNRLIEDLISNVVDNQMNIMHISIPTPNEVHGVVFAMSSISSPGPHGFGAHLFQTDWEIINDDVIKFMDFLFFLMVGSILIGILTMWYSFPNALRLILLTTITL